MTVLGAAVAGGAATPVDRLAEAEGLARRLAERPGSDPAVAARAARLAERIAARRYHLAVLGEFKRGKSTLVNALVGRPVLPTGAIPLTAVPTEVRFGAPPGVTVVLADGQRLAVPENELAAYVTEAGNAANRRRVRHVEVDVDRSVGAEWALPGVALVDTPGIASVHEHQSAAARDALAVADGAIVVLSADSPVSEAEGALLAELAERRCRVFVVVNKCDHLAPGELAEVRRFVAGQVRRVLGADVELFCVAARPAVEGPGDLSGELAAFREVLRRFVHEELAGARTAAALLELERLAAALGAAAALELAAAELGVERLDAQARRFEAAVEDGRRGFAEDRLLLDHELAALGDQLARRFEEGAARAAGPAWSAIAGSLEGVPLRRVDRLIASLVPAQVEGAIDPLRREAQAAAESAWADLAARFERRMRGRVEELRARAGELFEVHLPAAAAAPVRDEAERFTYLLLTVESPGTAAGRLVGHALPIGAVRRRVLARAEADVRRELAKHASRGRYDLVERVRAAERRFVGELAAELEETERSIRAAVERARALLLDGRVDRDARRRTGDEVASLVHEVNVLAAGHTVAGPAPER